ncbi:hypothetical protein M378DRAFT_464920 [Amanita muscaria Koide BX008]|uniref:Uncharacterized protein n=1 Tax=Amanita muscaria (strain Koide BX008) TaxID=946122 RepID=A0A0C2S1V0_AMAMK|nr:hypothetical protein M378DRAFT_464920 [Amanita muscaria Koide BX008]
MRSKKDVPVHGKLCTVLVLSSNMSASGSKSPSKSATRGSSHKRKKSEEEADIQRKRPSTASQLQSVDRFTEEIRDAQSREAGDREPPFMNSGNGDAQTREARGGVDPDPPIPTEALTIATETRSITLLQGSSNVQISDTKFTTIGGDATIFQFGDGQFTEAQRNLVRRICACRRSKHNLIFVDL